LLISKGRAVKSARRKFGSHYESDDLKLASHTMVIKRGNVEKDIKDLINDMRHVMEPFTASELKVTKKNSLKDFIAIAGPLHVTHLIIFSQTEIGDYMKMMRLPRGPTLTFKMEDFSLINDVLSVVKKKYNHKKQYLHQPLLILNGFNSRVADSSIPHIEPHLKLITTTLQNMFPSINVTKVNLKNFFKLIRIRN
jgi:ribosome biogenesis protein SSF1/2